MRIITCISFHGTGSGAVDDFFKEFDNCPSAPTNIECRFLQDPDGVSDLEYNLVENPHRLNSGYALRRYMKFAHETAYGYKKIFGRKWLTYSQEYVDSLVTETYKGYWHGDLQLLSGPQKFIYYSRRAKDKLMPKPLKKPFRYNYFPNQDYYHVHITREEFLEKTQTYVDKLCRLLNPKNHPFLVLDQFVATSNIMRYLKYVKDIRVIVVDRDPRDLFVQQRRYGDHVLPAEAEPFARVFRDHREMIGEIPEDAPVLRLQFEDLIFNYDEEMKKIVEFVGEDWSHHVAPKKYFNPAVSANNTQMWKKFPEYAEACETIARMLPEFLYDFENHVGPMNRVKGSNTVEPVQAEGAEPVQIENPDPAQSKAMISEEDYASTVDLTRFVKDPDALSDDHNVLPEDAQEYAEPGAVSLVTDEKLASGQEEIQNLRDAARAEGLKKKLTPEEIKLVEMNIFRHFIRFCSENKLRWTVDSGTLIGAVRHEGFIPWDDDIDITMPRPDYDRFIELAREKKIGEHLSLVHDLESGATNSFAKIIDDRTLSVMPLRYDKYNSALWIDVFPVDGRPDDEKEFDKALSRLGFLEKARSYSYTKSKKKSRNPVKAVLKKMYVTAFRPQMFLSAIRKVPVKFPYTDKKWGISFFGVYKKMDKFHPYYFTDVVWKKFEDINVRCTADFAERLTDLYGESFMTPPPPEKRIAHGITAYWQ